MKNRVPRNGILIGWVIFGLLGLLMWQGSRLRVAGYADSSELSARQAPTLTSIVPGQTPVGQVPKKITLRGSGFSSGATVLFNSTPVTAKVKGSDKILLKNPSATLFQTDQTYDVRVQLSNGQVSNVLKFVVGTGSSQQNGTIRVDAPRSLVVNVGTTVKITAVAVDQNGTPIPGATIAFISDNPDRATVDATGTVTGVLRGAATIRLTAGTITRRLVFAVNEVNSTALAGFENGDIVRYGGAVYVSDREKHILMGALLGQPLGPLAGRLNTSGNIDGIFGDARFNGPLGIGISGDQIFMADTNNRSIRRVNLGTGQVRTVVALSDMIPAGITDWAPRAVAIDSNGDLYVTDAANHTIWQITLNTTLDSVTASAKLLAGEIGQAGGQDGIGRTARFNSPQKITLTGNILSVVDRNAGVRQIALPGGAVKTIRSTQGRAEVSSRFDPQQSPTLGTLKAVASDALGNLYVAEEDQVRVLTINGEQVVTSELAQSGTFVNPFAIAIADNSILILDSQKTQASLLRVAMAAPVINTVTPTQVGTGSSTEVTITGQNFIQETQVLIGQQLVQNLQLVSSGELKFTLPAQPTGGTVPIAVRHRGGTAQSSINVSGTPQSTVNLSAFPTERSLRAGQSTTFTLSLGRTNATQAIDLSAQVPAGLSATISPNPVAGDSSQVTVTSSPTVSPGRYNVQVTGTASGVTVSSVTVSVVVEAQAQQPSVVLASTPGSRSVSSGQSTTYAIDLRRTNYQGVVNLSAGLVGTQTTGIDLSFNPASTSSNTATLTARTSAAVPRGEYTIRVNASFLGGSAVPIQVLLVVNPDPAQVTLSLAQNSQTVNAGDAAPYTVTGTTSNFSGSVNLSLTGNIPFQATISLSPSPMPVPGSSTLTIRTATTTPPGTYAMQVVGSASGVSIAPVPFTLTVRSAQGQSTVAMAISPATQTAASGQNAEYALTLRRTNFTGAVDIRVTATGYDPFGGTITGDTATITVWNTTPGTYTFTVTGTAQGATVTNTVTFTLVVSQQSGGPTVNISASPGSMTVNRGQSANYAINLSRNGFTGPVTLQTFIRSTTIPPGITLNYSQNPVTGATTTLTLFTTTETPGGTYNFYLEGTATGATVTRSADFTLVVNSTVTPTVNLGVSPTTQTVTQGQGSTFTVALNRTNFTGSVSLQVFIQAQVTEPTITFQFAQNPTTGNSTSLSMSTTSATPPGVYTFFVRGTASGANVIDSPTFTVVVNSGNGGSENGCAVPFSINIGQTIDRTLDTSCVYQGTQRNIDVYRFNGTAGQQVTITLSSSAFDAYLYLFDSNRNTLASDDDTNGTDSQIVFTLPYSGSYQLDVTSYFENSTGPYRLVLAGAGGSCNYSISPTSRSHGAGTETGSVSVTTTSGCNWTATSNSTFVTITSGTSGSGSGSVSYRVDSNTGSTTRTGTLTIAGQTFTITQAAGGGGGEDGCVTPFTVSIGQTINRTLDTSCAYQNTTQYLDTYRFSGTQGQSVTITLSSSAFDTFVYLLDANRNTLASNDDFSGTNSQVSFTLPSTGLFGIDVTSAVSGATGPYTLVISAGGGTNEDGCVTPYTINFGQTVRRTLDGSCVYSNNENRFVDVYRFNGSAGQQVTITHSSTAFDAYLYLYMPGTLLAEDDDSAGGTNARIVYTLPSSGTYFIDATAFSDNATGDYSLSLSGGSLNRLDRVPQPTDLEFGETVVVKSDSTGVTFSQKPETYQFLGQPGQQVIVTLTSPAPNWQVHLKDPSGNRLVENAMVGNPTSHLTQTLQSGGFYEIEVSSTGEASSGGYTLTLARISKLTQPTTVSSTSILNPKPQVPGITPQGLPAGLPTALPRVKCVECPATDEAEALPPALKSEGIPAFPPMITTPAMLRPIPPKSGHQRLDVPVRGGTVWPNGRQTSPGF